MRQDAHGPLTRATAASRVHRRVWFVALAPLTDPGTVAPAVASALSVADAPGQSVESRIGDAVPQKRLLLVLDNCEHLIDACATLANVVLAASADVGVLATSPGRGSVSTASVS